MPEYILSPRALKDLDAIGIYFAVETLDAHYGNVLLTRLFEGFDFLADNHGAGHWRPIDDPGRHFRFWNVDSYQIVYRELANGDIAIARILHQSRDIRRLIREEKKKPD